MILSLRVEIEINFGLWLINDKEYIYCSRKKKWEDVLEKVEGKEKQEEETKSVVLSHLQI
jgi:hypothetical protein